MGGATRLHDKHPSELIPTLLRDENRFIFDSRYVFNVTRWEPWDEERPNKLIGEGKVLSRAGGGSISLRKF